MKRIPILFLMIGGVAAGLCSAHAAPDDAGAIPVTWVSIPAENADYPASGRPPGSGFTGGMSKYPITNAQYAEYLNAALALDALEVAGVRVVGKTGDHAGSRYCELASRRGFRGGGAAIARAKIRYDEGAFTVDEGFENHPVTFVTWCGAVAFANHYGWRLPTEWEWESVANYNDGRRYATGNSLYGSDRFLANYLANGDDICPPNDLPYHAHVRYGTTPVGYFGTYGYGLADMAGNVWEWTTTESGGARGFRGGGWSSREDGCHVSFSPLHDEDSPDRILRHDGGFRVCR